MPPVDPDAVERDIAVEFDSEVTWMRAEHLIHEAREVADIADEMLRRGLTTPERLEEMGVPTNDTLDIAAEENRLLEEVGRAFGLGLLKGHAFNVKVRRGRGGQFADKPGKSIVPSVPHAAGEQAKGGLTHPARLEAKTPTDDQKAIGVVKRLKGTRGGVKGKEFSVFDTPEQPPIGTDPHQDDVGSERPTHMTTAQLSHDRAKRGTTRRKVEREGQKRLSKTAAEKRRAARQEQDPKKKAELEAEAKAKDEAHGDPVEVEAAGKQAMFGERAKKLDKRIKKLVKKTAKKGELDEKKGTTKTVHGARGTELAQSEIHLNDAGRISQRTLLTFAEEEASQPTTVERYRNPDGSYVESRAALHARIIDGALRERNSDGSISYTNPYLPPQKVPQVLFTGGGYAAGKGTIQKAIDAWGQTPPDAMLLDPDVLKAELPEFQDMIGDDPEANLLVYQEAWDIAQEIQEAAKEKMLNIVVDGIANTSSDEVKERVKGFKDAGYGDVRMVYVSLPTDVAIERATLRAQNAEKDSDRRMIPEVVMRAVHRDVSATLPGVIDGAAEMGATVEVWDTNVDWGEMPNLTAIAHPDGKTDIVDDAKFQEILDKANEGIEGLDQQKEGPRAMPKSGIEDPSQVGTHIDPAREKEVGAALSAVLPASASKKHKQPVSDPDELIEMGEKVVLPDFRELLDRGEGINKRIGASFHDMSAGGSFSEAAQEVADNMDKPHVLIGPIKKKKRIMEKAIDGDASNVSDVVRATVLVPSADDLAVGVSESVAELEAKGWKVDEVRNRVASEAGASRMDSGYGDIMVIAAHNADGMECEVQVNTTQMWYAKEVGEGHTLYQAARPILEKIDREGREPTKDEAKKLQQIDAKGRPIYDHAWSASLAAKPKLKRKTEKAATGRTDNQARNAQIQEMRKVFTEPERDGQTTTFKLDGEQWKLTRKDDADYGYSVQIEGPDGTKKWVGGGGARIAAALLDARKGKKPAREKVAA